MRKFLLTLAVLCGTVSAWAQELVQITTDTSNPIYYTIYNTRSDSPGGFLYYAGDNAGLKDGCNATTLEDKYKFYFTGSDNELYVHNAATTKKLASVTEWTETGVVWCVIKRNDGNLAFGPKDGDRNANVWWNEQNQGRDGYTTWNANDAGSGFVVEPASEFAYPEIGKFYTIEAPLFEKVQGVAKGLVANGGNALGWNTVDLTNKNYYWTLVNQDGNLYLKNVGTGLYINGDAVRDTPAALTTYALGSNQFNIVTSNVKLHAAGHDSGNGASGGVTGWDGTVNSASAWTFVERADPDATIPVTIKYSFTYDGVEKFTQETNTLVGEEYPAINVVFPFGVSAINLPEGTILNEGIIEGVKEVEIQLSVELPFVPATSNSTINNWYYIQMHSSGGSYSRYLQNMDTYIEWLDVEMTASDDKDSYTWAFVGNPFDGFKLVNKAAGTDKAVCSTGSGNPTIDEYTNAVAWEIKNSRTNNDSEHFCFMYPDGQYMNAQNGKVAFWNDNDQGSTMWVTERDFTGATELQALIDQVNGYSAGTSVGYCTQASIETLNNAIKAAETALQGTMTAEISAQHTTNINNALTAIETIQPEEGKFYIIKSAMPSTDGRSGKKIYVNNDGGMKFENACTMAHVFQFVNAGANTFYLKCVERGTYLSTNKAHAQGQHQALATTTENAKAMAIANMGRENVVSLIPTGGAMIHAQADNSVVVAWNNTENTNASAWIIEELDINTVSHSVMIDEFEWATLVLGYNATIPEGVTAYVASSVESNYVNLTEVSSVIPANTAVLLNAAKGTYSFNYSAENGSVDSNKLFGYTITTGVTEDVNSYALTDNGENAVFGKFTGTTNKAFKAYLDIPVTSEEAAARFLVFNITDGTETGIENIEGTGNTANAAIYDLSGRRMHNAQKGIFIVNGKKVVK